MLRGVQQILALRWGRAAGPLGSANACEIGLRNPYGECGSLLVACDAAVLARPPGLPQRRAEATNSAAYDQRCSAETQSQAERRHDDSACRERNAR